MTDPHSPRTEVEQAISAALSPASFLLPGTNISSAWVEHTPFAAWLIEATRPKCLVELGTLHGVSYFTFCEVVQRIGSGTRCYAVDTWEGDTHTGFYDDAVWTHVVQTNARNYAGFSTLLRRLFDDALPEFEDGSIDLLHIDGRHFYEDVKHDFLSWVPKLSSSAVVIFHDTNVHERDFGVWKLWRELKAQYPSFEFLHGNGLGVLAFGSSVPPALDGLFEASKVPEKEAAVRSAYARLGAAVSDRLMLRHEESIVARLRTDVGTIQADGRSMAAEIERLRERNAALSDLKERLEKTEQARLALENSLADQSREREFSLAQHVQERGQHQSELNRLSDEIASLTQQRAAIFKSRSWRLTAPMRFMGRRLRTPARIARAVVRLLKDPNPRGTIVGLARDWRAMRSLSKSGLFDRDWYTSTYRDVPAHSGNPLWHFIRFGASEGRRPNEFFDTRWYLDTYPDVKESKSNPLLHYLVWGVSEGRDPNPDFSTTWYLASNEDVAEAKANPLAHYLRFGKAEGRPLGPPHLESDERAVERAVERHRAPGSAHRLPYEPLISIITPVYNIDAIWLRKAVASVQAQSYPNWELCICDDGSTKPETISALEELERSEPRMRVVRLTTNVGISRATNKALELASGEFVALLDNDDELTTYALETCVVALNADRSIDVLYSDEDKLNAQGDREEPFFKPDWSPHLLREVMYVGHLLVARRSLVTEVGSLDPTYDGVQDFELMLRLSEHTERIHHVREILYHWRRIPGSVADQSGAKPGLGLKQVAAVNAHLTRLGIQARAVPHPSLEHRAQIQPLPRDTFPRVSIVIPTKDAGDMISRCLDSIYAKTVYPNFEVVVVDNGTTDPIALSAMARHPVIRVDFAAPFNFSRANNIGVEASTGEVLVLLNNDTEVVQADWLEQMLFLLEEPGIAAVGPLLLYPQGTVQHAGVALGLRGTADHVMRGLPAAADGYFGTLACTREVSAVTFACTMLRKVDYVALGGLEELYRTHYQDVDFCLRLLTKGKKILYTPRATLVHHESATRGSDYDMIDRALFLDVWQDTIAKGDPYSRWEAEAREHGVTA